MNLLVVSKVPVGGIRTYMRYVYAQMPSDVHITVVAESDREQDSLEKDVEGFGGRLVACPPGKMGLLKGIWSELMKGDYDVIQSHGYKSCAYAAVANLFHRIPHVTTIHGVIERRFLTGALGKVKEGLLKWSLAQADKVNFVGEDIGEHVKAEMPFLQDSSKCVVITNGIDTEWFAASEGDSDKLLKELEISDSFVLGFLGRFMPQKGLDILIDALKIWKKSTPSDSLVVLCCGSGDYEKEYKELVKENGLDTYIRFIPFRRDPRDVYYASDAIVMPSRWEAYSLVTAEALSCGRPLIASDCIGLREAVEKTPALSFPSEDAEALAGCIQRVLAEDMKPIFKEYQKEAVERYHVRKTAAQLADLFRDMAK